MKLLAADWEQALEACGVRAPVAHDWAPAFASEWQPDRFSQGMDDIVDLLPQVLHETGLLEHLEENLNYSAERLMAVWPNRFPTIEAAQPFAHNPQALAEKVYGGRMGNVPGSGDAYRFRGQSLPMFTGRAAFEHLSDLSGQDLTVNTDLVLQKYFAAEFTRRWWEHDIPDGCLSDQVLIRRRVNGGRIGLEHCQQLAETCRRAFA